MKVMVTGATGFVGGHLVEHLLQRGDDVTALVRSASRAQALANAGARLVIGDLGDRTALVHAASNQDVVYHIAGMLGAVNEAALLVANRDGTRNVATACAAQPIPPRLVVVSSMAAGGPAKHGAPRTADGHDAPVTMYGRSKLAAERVLPAIAVPWVVVRPPAVYGPGDRDGFLPAFRAVNFGLAPMFGDGSMEVSLIHVEDLAEAIIAAGITPDLSGEVFYVNNPEVVTQADLMRSIAAAMNHPAFPVHIPRWAARAMLTATGQWAHLFRKATILHADKVHEFFQEAWTADPRPFMTATGWQPRWNLTDGLADTAAWYRAEKWA